MRRKSDTRFRFHSLPVGVVNDASFNAVAMTASVAVGFNSLQMAVTAV